MEKPVDLRIQKTHKALFEAFMELLEEKRFEEVTVNELCDRAMVRRATFYKHFGDKYEFFVFFIKQVQSKFEVRSMPLRENQNRQLYYIDMFEQLIAFLDANEKMVQRILESNMMPTLLDMLGEHIMRSVQEKLEEDITNGYELPAAPEVLAAFYAGGVMQTLRWWLPRKSKLSRRRLTDNVESLLKTMLFK